MDGWELATLLPAIGTLIGAFVARWKTRRAEQEEMSRIRGLQAAVLKELASGEAIGKGAFIVVDPSGLSDKGERLLKDVLSKELHDLPTADGVDESAR